MRRVFVIALMFAAMISGQALGFSVPSPLPENITTQRVIPSDPKLPKYDNPFEIDIDGPMHISFQGAFRRVLKDGKPDKYVVFCFVAVPKKDMELRVEQSELFDNKARRFQRGKWTPDIGIEATSRREIIADIPIQVRFGVEMPIARSELLPSIARVSFRFNGQWYQFRNIKAEEWHVWQSLREELGLYEEDQ